MKNEPSSTPSDLLSKWQSSPKFLILLPAEMLIAHPHALEQLVLITQALAPACTRGGSTNAAVRTCAELGGNYNQLGNSLLSFSTTEQALITCDLRENKA